MYQQNHAERLILASASPRRAELLASQGLVFEIVPAQIDESSKPGEDPAALVERLAFEKAFEVAKRAERAWVLGADTIVVLKDHVLGKPADRQDAARMLNLIQGRRHKVFGGMAVVNLSGGTKEIRSYVSEVEIVPLTPKQIEQYIHSGEPLDKAGSYAIQGLGAALVSAVQGSYTNIVGLNLSASMELLAKYGLVN